MPLNDQCAQEENEGNIDLPHGDVSAPSLQQLSVNVETASEHSGTPKLVLRQIWAKALNLLNANQVLPPLVVHPQTVQ